MEDLDSLLEDLGRSSTKSSGKKSRPPSSRVDLNELETLMQDLATPTPSKAPEPTPVIVASTVTPSSPPAVRASIENESPRASTKASSNDVDDLDALMESLNTTSQRSSRRPMSTRTVPTEAKASEPVRPAEVAPYQSRAPAPAAPAPAPAPAAPAPTPAGSRQPAALKNDDLDALLNNLTQQMDNIDSDNPNSKGICGYCKKPILGEVIQAIGKTYHPEHFVCSNCQDSIGGRNFYESNGQPHCEKCYKEMFCPRCAHCNQGITDRCVSALGKKWHVEHFICTKCLKPFPGGAFFERDGRPYCEDDFYGLFAPKCGSCGDAIRGDCINALGVQWHPEHFVCHYCQKAFVNGIFFEYQGKPYCETHYHLQTGSLCAGCGKAISGRCVSALDKKWHPEHFVCAFCMNPLAGGSFSEQSGKAYCKECHGKLFAK